MFWCFRWAIEGSICNINRFLWIAIVDNLTNLHNILISVSRNGLPTIEKNILGLILRFENLSENRWEDNKNALEADQRVGIYTPFLTTVVANVLGIINVLHL